MEEIASVACALESEAEPIGLLPSLKVIDPVGVPVPDDGVTVLNKVVACP